MTSSSTLTTNFEFLENFLNEKHDFCSKKSTILFF